ncbi:hypothetical protein A6R68_24144, partial [Neotoma lepida]
MSSPEGRYKAFSTCGSHLSIVSLFYGTGFGVYISSTVTESSRKTAVASVLYSVVPQMMNPFIYSLRNRDMKEALKRLFSATHSLFGIVNGLLHSLMVLHLSFCTDLEILHFFCELAQVLKLACSDSLINNILIFITASIFAGIPLFGIIFSYIHIVSTVVKMSSSEGKYKAFSTCGSHLSVVSLFYGTGFGVYITSEVIHSPRDIAVASVMYSLVTPMMNPFIYSLRNRDMKEALKKV